MGPGFSAADTQVKLKSVQLGIGREGWQYWALRGRKVNNILEGNVVCGGQESLYVT